MIFILISIGISFGADFKMSFGGGLLAQFYSGFDGKSETDIMGYTTTVEAKDGSMEYMGIFLFFDATYVELSLAYCSGGSEVYVLAVTRDSGGDIVGMTGFTAKPEHKAIEVCLLGKYPFTFGRFDVFPLLGISYLFVFHVEEKGITADKPSDSNTLGFHGGFGTDFALTKSLFLRGEFLWSIRIPSQSERDAYDKIDWGMGPRLKLGLGYYF